MDDNTEQSGAQVGNRSDPIEDPAVELRISKKTLRRASIWIGIALGVGALAIGISAQFNSNKFNSALKNCQLDGSTYVSLDENGHGVYLDGSGTNNQGGLSTSSIGCFLTELKVPNSVIQRMDHTSALMGAQSANFDGIEIDWTYHPSNGLDISFTIK